MTEKTKLAQAKENNDRIRSIYSQLLRKHGSLYLHLSGEGKISFNSGQGSFGFIQTSFDGDMGCLEPIDHNYQVCAKTTLMSYLSNLELSSHLNLSGNENLVPDESEWLEGLQTLSDIIKEDCDVTEWKQQIFKDELVVTITIKAISNPFVTGVWVANYDADYITQFDDTQENVEQPIDGTDIKLNISVVDGNGVTHHLTKENTVYLVKHSTSLVGHHLLKDNQSGKYFIIDEDDYCPQ